MTEQANKKKKATVAAAVVTALALLFTGTFAWVSTAQSATNQFVKTDYQVVLHDKFDGVDVEDGESHRVEFDAGDTVNKDIWVENAGSDNILVRVKLTENMSIKQNNGATQTIGTADAVHNLTASVTPTYGDDCADIHSHVTWTSGTVKTFDEWEALETTKKYGAFWVMSPDGWAYWMQPLAPSDPMITGDSIQPGTSVGHTGLLLDAVKLNESETGHIDYTIKAEMDAIDAGLAGLAQEGTTWTGDYASIFAGFAQCTDHSNGNQRMWMANSELIIMNKLETETDPAKLEALNKEKEALNKYNEAYAAGDELNQARFGRQVSAYAAVVENGGSVTVQDDYTVIYNNGDDSTLYYMDGPDENGVLTIPNGITIVGQKNNVIVYLPQNRDKVKEIVVPEGVKKVEVGGLHYFYNCTKITLPDSLEVIFHNAFNSNGRNSESGLVFTKGLADLPALTEVTGGCLGSVKFAGDITANAVMMNNTTYMFNNAVGKNVTVQEGVEKIGGCTFEEATFEEVSIPQSVTTIGTRAFKNLKCTKLKLPRKFQSGYEAGSYGKIASGTVEYYD